MKLPWPAASGGPRGLGKLDDQPHGRQPVSEPALSQGERTGTHHDQVYSALFARYGCDFDSGSTRETRNADRGTGGAVLLEIPRVDGIHAGEQREIGQKDFHVDDVGIVVAGSLQDDADALESIVNFVFELAGVLPAVEIGTRLSGTIQCVAELNAGAVGPPGGEFGRRDDLLLGRQSRNGHNQQKE